MSDVRRREFIALLGGATAAWPRAARAEQGGGQGAFAPFTITDDTLLVGQIIPASRMTDWTKPGLTARGGIPHRTTIFKTLSPLGGGQDDDPQIRAAINACPEGQVVQLTAGVFRINGGPGWRCVVFNKNNVTLRGAGPGRALAKGNGGVFVEDPTATQLIKINQQQAGPIITVNTVDPYQNNVSENLSAVAPKGSFSATVTGTSSFRVGLFVLIDQITNNHPDVFWGTQSDGPGGGSRRWYTRQDRSLGQIMEITAISGNTLTFATPLHCAFDPIYNAQVTRFDPNGPTRTGIGIEDLYTYGTTGGYAHIAMNNAAYCWIKHCDLHWFRGQAISLSSCYRCEVRETFMHETPNPEPAGTYILDINHSTSDCLIENNIMWYANKNIVARPGGGGNVIAYNYMDDAFGSPYPDLPEAALNCEHMTTSHMELCEGNYAPNYTAGSGFGNSVDIMLFRNHLSAIRAASPPLDKYMSGPIPYVDIGMPRMAASVHARNLRQSFVGNVLGKQDQKLISVSMPKYSRAQTTWRYEQLDRLSPGNEVPMWYIGAMQSPTGWTWEANTIQTVLREGNWDWFTQRQRWHGVGGRGNTDTSTPKAIPNSLYLSSKPAFFGNNPWPWVDPSTGATYVLPAKARFDAGTPNKLG